LIPPHCAAASLAGHGAAFTVLHWAAWIAVFIAIPLAATALIWVPYGIGWLAGKHRRKKAQKLT
jgi:hypothetical protein